MVQKHHYISRFYLNYFSPVKHPGKIWVYTNKKPELRSIKKHVACIENFYTIDTSNGESNIIEIELGKIETRAGRIIKKVNENDFNMTKDELNVMIIFMSYLRARTPALRDSVNKPVVQERKLFLKMLAQHEELFNKYNNELNEDEKTSFPEFKKYVSDNINNMNLVMSQNEAVKSMVVAAQELQKMLNIMSWNFLIAPNDFYYLTSDRPVFPFMNNWKMWYQPGFGFKDVEVYFPVTPKICMMGTYRNLSASRIINADMVNVINSRIMANSYQFVYANINESAFWDQSNITINKVKTKYILSRFCY